MVLILKKIFIFISLFYFFLFGVSLEVRSYAGQWRNLSEDLIDCIITFCDDGSLMNFTITERKNWRPARQHLKRINIKTLDMSRLVDPLKRFFLFKDGMNRKHNLQCLDLQRCAWDQSSFDCLLIHLQFHFPHLKSLILSNNAMSDFELQSLSEIFLFLPRLKRLDLSYNNIGVLGLKYLSRSCHYLQHLHSLELSDNVMGDAGVQLLSEVLIVLPNLKYLDLKFNGIGVLGAKWLAQGFSGLPLTALDLGGNQIGNEGVKWLAEKLSELSQLRDLGLGCTDLGDTGAQLLSAVFLLLPRLKRLDLSYNEIGVLGLQSLSQTTVQLNLIGNQKNEVAETLTQEVFPFLQYEE